ncbi:MAG: GAF domain-containing protein, partial [Nocardioidaceae bacterium]
TLAATSDAIAGLDAVQYLDGGPCVEAAQERREIEVDDILDEEHWRMFSQSSAAAGVRSSLTLPLLDERGSVIGTVNLYASVPDAFESRAEQLAEALGASAAKAVSNADLSFDTRLAAVEAPRRLVQQDEVDTAVGMIVANQNVDVATARERLRTAAARADLTEAQVARVVMGLMSRHL